MQNLRVGFRFVLGMGVLASVAANVAVANGTLLGWLVAAAAPVTLFATIEMLARMPFDGSKLAWLRLVTTGLLGAAGAWVSYWHMVTLAELVGEGYISAHLLPLMVDGMMLVATVSLIEVNMKIREQDKLAKVQRLAELSLFDRISLMVAEKPTIKNVQIKSQLEAEGRKVSAVTVGKYRKLTTAAA